MLFCLGFIWFFWMKKLEGWETILRDYIYMGEEGFKKRWKEKKKKLHCTKKWKKKTRSN